MEGRLGLGYFICGPFAGREAAMGGCECFDNGNTSLKQRGTAGRHKAIRTIQVSLTLHNPQYDFFSATLLGRRRVDVELKLNII